MASRALKAIASRTTTRGTAQWCLRRC
jgi:hypothetical protein